MSYRQLLLSWLAALTIALPGWAANSPPAPNRADSLLARTLQDHSWTLQSASGAGGQPIAAVIVPGHRYVLQFDGARLSIAGGCNRMNGPWQIDAQGQMQIGRLAATMMACETPLMQADTALAALLAQPLNIALTAADGPLLHLSTPGNDTLVFSGQRTWQSLYGEPTRIFLEVAAQTVDCKAAKNGQCLRVRERFYDKQGLQARKPGKWRSFAEPIEGYTHKPGVRNVLRIDRYQRDGAPAHIYVLDLIVESAIEKN